ncbi:MAG: formylglycine-generating enzyme family protein, partial [Planktothrix sp.]
LNFTLEDREYEVAKIINFLPLETFEYEPAIITDILERFEFETAELILGFNVPGQVGDAIDWIIQRSTVANWGYTESLGNEIGLDMLLIPSGTFLMGAPEAELESTPSERPQHEVTVKSFYMGRYPITQAQWREVASYPKIERELQTNPSRFKEDNCPVEKVLWRDATEFCRRLSAKTGREYRLPSEAEWEYACRAGTTTPFHFGNTITPELANYDGNYIYNEGPQGEYREMTTEVGSFPANAWGLHDMHGNIWEWCEDDWHKNYQGAPNDGTAWIEENRTAHRVRRGGSWNFHPKDCRSAFRPINYSGLFKFVIGLRVVCEPPTTLGRRDSLILISQENSTNSDPP